MKEIRHLAQQLYGYNMDFSIDQIRPTFPFNETCQHTVPQAIEAFLESHDFESAIRLAVSLGGDSDTIACITGGMAEAYYGVPDAYKKAAMTLLPPQMQEIVTRMYGNE